MTVKCATEIVRDLSSYPSNGNIVERIEPITKELTTPKTTSFSDLAKEMELANQQRVAAAAAAAHILSAAAAVAQAAQTYDNDSRPPRHTTSSPSHSRNHDFMAAVTSKRTTKSKLTFSVDSLLETKYESTADGLRNEDEKPEDLSVVTGEEEEEDNEDEINVNDEDNDYMDDEEDDEEEQQNCSFSPSGINGNKHTLEHLPKLAIPTPLLPGHASNPSGSSPYLAGYLAAVAAANGSSLNTSGSTLPISRPTTSVSSHSAAANLLSAINRWPSPAGGLPPGFPFGGLQQNPFLRPGM